VTGGLMAITAHPDDEVLIAGGTLAACSELGIPTAVVCLTHGENGPIADPSLATPKTLGAVRARELDAACAELGVEFVKCYRRQDGSLRWSDRSQVAAQLTRLIDRRQPELVVTFGEEGLYWHQDHIAAYELARNAVRRSDVQPALYRSIWAKSEMRMLSAELRRRHLPDTLWGFEPEDFGVDDADRDGEVVVDVRRFVARKLRALHCHRTQLEPGHLALGLPEDLAERFLGFERFAPVELPGRPSRTAHLFDRLAFEAAHA
jgi:LmbE family N-acetylglucosaminyl deacetylase